MDPSDQLPFVDPAAAPVHVPDPAAEPAPVPEPADDPDGEHVAAPPTGPVPTQAAEPVAARPGAAFQAAAGIQGRQFAEQCDTLLATMGFELRGRRVITEVGIEIDQEAVSPTGTLVWFEYKGSVQGNRPGLRRTDTLKKAIANGSLLRALADPAPYVVITSHLPEAGSGAAMLAAALRLQYVADVVCLYEPKDTARLRRW
jgi:hypothetical protein